MSSCRHLHRLDRGAQVRPVCAKLIYIYSHLREFAGASLKELSIPLVEDKTGEISRSFGVFDPTTHTALPTAFILDDQGEMMASFTTSTKVFVVRNESPIWSI